MDTKLKQIMTNNKFEQFKQLANVYIGKLHKSLASRPTSSAVTLSSRPLSRQRSFIPMRTLPIHVDLVTLVPGSS